MAKRTMNKAFLSLWAPLLLLAPAACHGPVEQPPLAGAAIGGHFVLTDQDGKRFDSASLAGRYPILYFGYTFCPDICPLDMQVLGQALKALEAKDPATAAKVQPIFVTVDPERDTPAVLKTYVAAFSPRLMGLTGSPAEIAKVAKDYAIFYQKAPASDGGTGYLMNHSREALLFGPDGKPIAMLPVDADKDQVVAAIEKWVK
ncbi:SCO family protein [Sphingomonas sp. MMS24-J13]|uniref:SCO family protein n=1 Tax=Sphingomonas sp. MMS24-J13 TaxID=3238686 RepID=UPI00384A62E7